MQLETDIALSDDGDLILVDDDFVIISNDNQLRQQSLCRIKSVKSDWFIDAIGADMEELIGEPNTSSIGDRGQAKLIEALTQDGFLDDTDIMIEKMPSTKYSIVYDIKIRSSEKVGFIPIQVILDLTEGIFVL